MAITFVIDTILAKVAKHGSETIDLAVGKHIKIETSPQGVEILDAVVPAGKKWRVTISVYIEETDA